MNKIKFGWSEISLVPEGRRLQLAGQFYERISGEVETPLCATALAIECGNEQVIFVACDLIYTSKMLIDKLRAALPDGCGFDKEKLVISAIHTHTSMSYKDSNDEFTPYLDEVLTKFMPEGIKYVPLVHDESPDIFTDDEAEAFILERLSSVIAAAWENRTEGSFAFGFGRAAIGLCRRVCYDDGSAKMWGSTNTESFTELETGNDSGIELMFTYGKDEKLTGVVANIACPAQVLEHQSVISSDYIGKVRALIKQKYGESVGFLGLIAPSGDLCPRDMIRWVSSPVCKNDPNIPKDNDVQRRADPSMFEISGCELAAKRIANEIFWALEDVTERKSETELIHKSITLDIPLRRVSEEENERALAAIKEFFDTCESDVGYEDNARMQIYGGTVERFMLQQTMDSYQIEIHVLRLDDVAFATNPYELFLNYGNLIRARSPAKQTFLIQLCSGAFGYLPTEKAEKGSHYSAFVSSGTTGHEGGKLLVERTLEEIRDTFDK